MLNFLRSRFSPLKHRNFRLFFLAQSLSLTGNWMQELARSWIVINIVGNSSAMGALLMASAIPNLVFASKGGTLADKKIIKEILIVTQIALATIAFAVGVVVFTGAVQLWHLMVFAVLEGIIIAFDLPAFHKITPLLVPREDFQQALAINAVNFHLSRMTGPMLAGLIMSMSTPSMVFWINSVSFIGIVFVILSVSNLRMYQQGEDQVPVLDDSNGLIQAWRYIKKNPLLFPVVLQLFLVIGLVFPLLLTTLRVYLQSKFNLSADQYGLIFSAPGFGALLGSLTFLLWRPQQPLKALPYGISGMILFLVLIAELQELNSVVIALGLFSYSMFLSLSSLNVTIQLNIEQSIRGRISSLTGMSFVVLAPMMSGPIGVLSDAFGERRTMLSIAVLFGLGSAYLAYKKRQAGDKPKHSTDH